MANRKHFEICGLTDEADPENGLCVLYSAKPGKDVEAFRAALKILQDLAPPCIIWPSNRQDDNSS